MYHLDEAIRTPDSQSRCGAVTIVITTRAGWEAAGMLDNNCIVASAARIISAFCLKCHLNYSKSNSTQLGETFGEPNCSPKTGVYLEWC
jgi:hypothetical protein